MSAPTGVGELRQRVEALDGREPSQAIELTHLALAGSLDPAQKLWFLERQAAAQLRLRRWSDAMASARQGLTLAGVGTAQAVGFATQQGYAYLGLAQPQEALRVSDELAAVLRLLLKKGSGPEYVRALAALRMRGAALLAIPRKGEAMEQLTDVLRRYDAVDDPEGRAETLHMIASLRSTSGDKVEAVRTEQAAIDLATQAGLRGILPRLHSLMAYLQYHAGNKEAFQHELETAGTIAAEEGDEYIGAMVNFNLGSAALERQDWAQTLRRVDQAYPVFVRFGDLSMADLCRVDRGIALSRTGHPEGIALIRDAEASIATRAGQEVTLAMVQKTLAEELALSGDFKQAYTAQLEYQRRSDALREADNQKRIAEAEAAYQADRKQGQIEALEREHVQQTRFRWLWVLVGVLGLAAAAVGAIGRIYLKRAYRAMHDMALEDPLTGLHNRRYLSSRIGEELAQMRRQRHPAQAAGAPGRAPGAASAAFLLIDLDHFKSINDEHGHAAGDAVLRQTSTLLRNLVRQSDTIVRWGGEEFLVFAHITAVEEAAELAERICTRMAAQGLDVGRGQTVHRSCSVGFACYPAPQALRNADDAPSWESLVSLADQCLYVAKAAGRDRWVGVHYAGACESQAEQPALREGVASGAYVLQHRPGRDEPTQPHSEAAIMT